MSSAIKLRDLAAAKASSRTPETKGSTPLWKQKLQSRTGITTTSTPKKEKPNGLIVDDDASVPVLPPSVQGASDAGKADAPHGAVPEIKLTVIQPPPLLPKPELTRPEAPSDRSALLRQLRDLRTAGTNMVEITGGASHSASTSATTSSTPGPRPQPGTPAGATSAATTFRPMPGPSSPAPSLLGPPSTPLHQTALGLAPAASPRPTPHSWASQAHLSTPGAGAGPASNTPGPLSTPSLLGLRQQELKDTGGGFLTHYADPQDIATPHGRGGERGTGGGAGRRASGQGGATGGAGGSTPLSVLRTIHRVQQLQRLQREGSQLVEAIGDGS